MCFRAPWHLDRGPNRSMVCHRLWCPLLYSFWQLQEGADMGKYPSSPLATVPPISMAWEEEKHTSRSGTPRSGVGTEATGATWADRRRSLGESISSMPSEGDSADAAQGNVGEQLFYVHQLRERMSKEQIEMRSLIRLVFMVVFNDLSAASWLSFRWRSECVGSLLRSRLLTLAM